MRKIILFLILILTINSCVSQNLDVVVINLRKSEFRVGLGLSLIGIGLSSQYYIQNHYPRQYYYQPQFAVPIVMGATLTVCGLLEGFKREKNYRRNYEQSQD